MANIDVTELLTDPDFVDPISIVSRVPFVNNLGENTISETTVLSVGSVQPASGSVLQRVPEALRVANLRTFWVKGNIEFSEAGKYPVILVFKGKRFQVQLVFDWTNFGQGWCEGTCVAEALS